MKWRCREEHDVGRQTMTKGAGLWCSQIWRMQCSRSRRRARHRRPRQAAVAARGRRRTAKEERLLRTGALRRVSQGCPLAQTRTWRRRRRRLRILWVRAEARSWRRASRRPWAVWEWGVRVRPRMGTARARARARVLVALALALAQALPAFHLSKVSGRGVQSCGWVRGKECQVLLGEVMRCRRRRSPLAQVGCCPQRSLPVCASC